MLEFKRGIVISAKYTYEDNLGCPSQELVIKDSEGEEYKTIWSCFGFSYNDFFGEGDKVSFLYNEENKQVVRIKLNPFYKE